MSQQKVSIKIPATYGPDEREAIALQVIEHIRKRTVSGKDKDGNAFPKYSKSYQESLEFKAAGKSKKVNLTLTHEMLDALQYLTSKKGSIEIGYRAGDKDLNAKVEGNRIGSYGKPSGDSSKARDFLGIESEALASILRRFPVKDREKSKLEAQKILLAKGEADE